MRWGSPTATPPFEPLDLAPALMSTSRMRSSILGIYHPVGELIGQFGRLTDHTEGAPVPEPVEGGALLCPQ